MNAYHVVSDQSDYIIDADTLIEAMRYAYDTTGSSETIISVKPLGVVI